MTLDEKCSGIKKGANDAELSKALLIFQHPDAACAARPVCDWLASSSILGLQSSRGCLQPNLSFSRSPSLLHAPAQTCGPLWHVNKLRIHQCVTCGWGSHGLARWTLSSPADSFHNLRLGFLKDEPFWWSAPYGGPTTSAPFLHGRLPVACNTLRLMASIIYL